jgi:hypothetical protein
MDAFGTLDQVRLSVHHSTSTFSARPPVAAQERKQH